MEANAIAADPRQRPSRSGVVAQAGSRRRGACIINGTEFPSRKAAADHYGLRYGTVKQRIKRGWTEEDAVTLPSGSVKPRRKQYYSPGDRVFQWTVIREVETGTSVRKMLCRCGCGSEREVLLTSLLSGKSKRCGCTEVRPGSRYGMLTVIAEGEPVPAKSPSHAGPNRHDRVVECRCDCGNVVTLYWKYVRIGDTKSCGCVNRVDDPPIGSRFGSLVTLEASEKIGGSRKIKCRCDCGRISHRDFSHTIKGNVKTCGKCYSEKKSLVGKRFDRLVVVSESHRVATKSRDMVYNCVCDCGTKTKVRRAHLTKGNTRSCGCVYLDKVVRVKVGERFGRLTVIEERIVKGGRGVRYLVRCDCGSELLKSGAYLARDDIAEMSCGCFLRREMTIAGVTYESMAAAADAYEISRDVVSQRMGLGWDAYEALVTPVGGKPRAGIEITVFGVRYPSIKAVAKKFGVGSHTIRNRLSEGWTPEDAVSVPAKPAKRPIFVAGVLYESIKAAGKHYGIDRNIIYGRLKAGWTPEQAFEIEPPPPGPGSEEVNGEIYVVTQISTGKQYVGQTRLGVAVRWQQHVNVALFGGGKTRLAKAIRKHGQHDFAVEAVERHSTPGGLNAAEVRKIAELGTVKPNGFNATRGGGTYGTSGKPVVIHGVEFASLTAAASRYGINLTLLSSRLKAGMTPEDAVDTPVRDYRRPVVVDGVQYKMLKDAIDAYGVNTTLVYGRLKMGWGVAEAITTPVSRSTSRWRPVTVEGVTFENVVAAAKHHGVKPVTAHGRIANGWPVELAVTTPVRSLARGSRRAG